MTNKARVGIVGELGMLMGAYKINMTNMSLNRDTAGGRALTVYHLDSVPPIGMLDEIQKDADISNVQVVTL